MNNSQPTSKERDVATLLEDAERMVADFARKNPKWVDREGGIQDPWGAHAWLERYRVLTQYPSHEPEALPAQLLDVHAICDERDRLRKEFFELAHRLMNAGRFEDANEISKILGSSRPPPGVRRAHKWDGPGERCVVCGDKDWMQTDCQPDEEQLRTELRRALDFYVANHSRLSHLMEAVEAVCGPRPTPTKCAESPCDPSGG